MSTELMLWTAPLFFLAALVVISRLEKQISAVSRESYRLIAGGISVFALVALAALFRGLGMFDRLPFLSDEVFFDLVTWIFGITGSIFVLSGLSNWLPLARREKENGQRSIRRLDLIRKVEQLLGVESRLDAVLSATAEYMVSHFGLKFGAVYKYSDRNHRLRFVAATSKAPSAASRLELASSAPERLEKLRNGRSTDLTGLFDDTTGKLKTPGAVLPMSVDKRPVGFFVLWVGETAVLEDDDLLTLKLAIDAIERKIQTDRLRLKCESEISLRTWKSRLELIVSGARSARDAFSAAVQCAGQRLPVDYAALAMVDESGERMRRISWGPGGGVLSETGLPVPSEGQLTADAYRSGETAVKCNLQAESDISRGEIVTDGSVRSILAAPILIRGSVRGVVTFASAQNQAYTDWELKDMETAMPAWERLVVDELSRTELRRRDRRMINLSRMTWDISRLHHLNEVLAEAASVISQEINADIVRISTPNSRGAFLKSRTLVLNRSIDTKVPANGELIVSLMPLHEQVLRDGQAMLSGGGVSSNLVAFEREQAFARGVKSSMIVPVHANGQVAGVISVASMSEARKLHRDTGALTFVESVARCLGPSMPPMVPVSEQPTKDAGSREVRSTDRDIVAGVSDSIARDWSQSTDLADEMMDKYLALIDRSAADRERVLVREV